MKCEQCEKKDDTLQIKVLYNKQYLGYCDWLCLMHWISKNYIKSSNVLVSEEHARRMAEDPVYRKMIEEEQ